MHRSGATTKCRFLCLPLLVGLDACNQNPSSRAEPAGLPLSQLESNLHPLAQPLAKPALGDWLSQHVEEGQTFIQYHRLRPRRVGQEFKTIYLLLLGEFTPEQRRVLNATQEYLGLYFQSPVQVLRQLPLKVIPEEGRRLHPSWGTPQIWTSYVLDHLLLSERPSDAVAFLCFTSADLCSPATHNYVLGEARTWERLGVWSIHRNGDPAASGEEFHQCLRRTMHIATHETGHILAFKHCTAFQCNMNGANSVAEIDRQPLPLCPVCLRKLLWNLDAEPSAHLSALEAFYTAHHFEQEARWCERGRQLLKNDSPE